MERLWEAAFQSVLGKRITGVLVAAHAEPPQNQIFFIFDDGTYYEIYGAGMHAAKNVNRGGMAEVRAYVQGRRGVRILMDIADEEKA